MNMPPEVAKAADALLEALRNTDTYQAFDALKKSVYADEVNRRLLERFMHAQTALQMAAMAGMEPREEDTAEFEKLSTLLYDNPEITDYLLAQMRMQQLTAQILSRITDEAGISVDIREA